MSRFWTQGRIVGGLLVLGLIIPIAAAVLVIAAGADYGRLISPTEQGFAEMRAYARAYSLSTLLGAVGSLLSLAGLAMLSGLLRRAGDHTFSSMALALVTVSTILFVIELAFLMRVPIWLAGHMAETAELPEFYEPLRAWMSGLQMMTILSGLIGLLGCGVSILRTDILPQGLGWLLAGLSGFLLLVVLAGGGTPVGIVYVLPALIGVVLLVGPVRDTVS